MQDAVYKCDDILRVLKLKRKPVFAAGQQSRKSAGARKATSVCHPFFFPPSNGQKPTHSSNATL